MKKEVTIKDIAKELGIHHATVSRALQGSTKVNENTRNMILQAAREMGYTPNILAQNFRNGKTKVISFIIPDLKHHFFSRIISMITEMAREKGFRPWTISYPLISLSGELHDIIRPAKYKIKAKIINEPNRL